jgi:hypothetical protein
LKQRPHEFLFRDYGHYIGEGHSWQDLKDQRLAGVSRAAQRVGNDAELMQAAIKIMEELHPGINQR